MKKYGIIASFFISVALVFSFVSCKSEVGIEYKDRIIEKSYVASPVFTATSDEEKVNITISCQTQGAVIYYTTDGSIPTVESTKYTHSISITDDTIFQAIAVKDGMENSSVSYASYSVVNKIETKVETSIEYIEKIVKIDTIYASSVVFSSEKNNDGSVSVKMKSETDGGKIYFTTDGSTPTASSMLYSNPLLVTEDTTFKAIVIKDGVENSPVSVATISIMTKTITETKTEYQSKNYCGAVSFSVTGSGDDGVTVTMETATEDAEIYYTTGDAISTTLGTKYTKPITVTEDTTFQAMAVKNGIENSPISVVSVSIKTKTITKTQTVHVDKIYVSPVTFTASQDGDSVKLSFMTETSGATIYYTTDGSTPTSESNVYSTPITLSASTTVKSIAVKDGIENSPVSVADVSIMTKTITETKIEYQDKKYCDAVIFSVSGSGDDGVTVTMETATEDAEIYYTTGDAISTTLSTKYTNPITVTEDTIFQAMAVKSGIEDSPISVVSVSIKTKTITKTQTINVDKVYASPVTFTTREDDNGVKLTLVTETSDATIYYTTDGSTPTSESTVYSTPIALSASTTVKAIAVKAGIENSPVSVSNVSIMTKTITETKTEYQDKKYCGAVSFSVIGSGDDGVTVTMETATEDAEIYYTIGDTVSTTLGTKYTNPITVTEDTTFQAKAVKNGIEDSPISVVSVSIKTKTITKTEIINVDKVYASPVTFTTCEDDDRISLSLATETSGATIYYTTDGTTPTSESTVYSTPLVLSSSTTVKAIAVIEGIENSPVSVANVTLKKIMTGTPLSIALSATVPNTNKNGEVYTGDKSNTYVTVAVNVTSASKIKKVVWKKNGSINARKLLADPEATVAIATSDNAKWTFNISSTDESANGTYTVAAIDETGREEAEQITIDQFDFTGPEKVSDITGIASEVKGVRYITLSWINPSDSDFDHVEITYTSNDGKSESEPSEPECFSKNINTHTFTTDSRKESYSYSIICVDALGNKSSSATKDNIAIALAGFEKVNGGIVNGEIADSKIFINGRRVKIDDLLVCSHEVTQSEYELYCKYGGNSPSEVCGVGDNYPAYYVSWYDAIVYCNLRSMAEGLTPVYKFGNETDPTKWSGIVGNETDKYCGPSGFYPPQWDEITMVGGTETKVTTANGYRLPTEAEWEYIARGGNGGIPTKQTTYAGSDIIDDVAWYSENGFNSPSKTHEVKCKNPISEDLRIYDMSGNVQEWCFDLYVEKLSGSAVVASTDSSLNRVYRGGYFAFKASLCEVSHRDYVGPDSHLEGIGFRVVRNAE